MSDDKKVTISGDKAADAEDAPIPGKGNRPPPKKTLIGSPVARPAQAMLPDSADGMLRQDGPPTWDDDDDDLGEKTAALDLSALGLTGPGALLNALEEQDERTVASGMPAFLEDEPIDPNATVAMELPSESSISAAQRPSDEEPMERTMAMDASAILAQVDAARSMPPLPGDGVGKANAEQPLAEQPAFNDTLADSELGSEERTMLADAADFQLEPEEPEERTMLADAADFQLEPEEPEERTMLADAAEFGAGPTHDATEGEEKTRMGSFAGLAELPESESTMMFDASALLAPRESQGPQGVVTIVGGNDAGKEFFLRSETTVVGRGLDCDLVLNDPSVSRRHFRLERRLDEYAIVDLGSGNGSKVDGIRVDDLILEEGARIEIGTSVLSFGFVGSEKRAPVEVQVEVKRASGGLKAAFLLVLLLAVGAGVVFGGEKMGWWNVLGSQLSEAAKRKTEAEALAKAQEELGGPENAAYVEAMDSAREALSKGELTGASAALDEAKEQEGAVDEAVERLRARIARAAKHKALIAAQEQAINAGKPEQALRELAVVPSTSPFFTDADRLKDEAERALSERYLDNAYELLGAGKNGEARARFRLVLKLNPDNGEASAALEELKGKPDVEVVAAAAPEGGAEARGEEAGQSAEGAAAAGDVPTEPRTEAKGTVENAGAEPATVADLGAKPADVADLGAKPADVADLGAKPADVADLGAKPADVADLGAKPADVQPVAATKTPAVKKPATKTPAVKKPATKKPTHKPSVAGRKPNVRKPRARAPRPTGARPNFRTGYKLYSQKKFGAAQSHFRAMSDDRRMRRRDRKRAEALAGRVGDFKSVYGQASAAVKGFQPVVAIPLLQKARSLDKAINGTFGGEIRRNLARMYAFRAAGAYSSNKYKKAAKLARKALSYNEGEASARLIYEKVESKVEGMLAQGRSAKAAGNTRKAEKILKTVLSILPASDPRYREARRTLNEIMAARADEDDD